MPDHENLPGVPDSEHEEEQKENLELTLDHVMRSERNAFAAQNQALGQEISQNLESVELASFRDSGLDNAQNMAMNPENVAMGDPYEQSQRFSEYEERLEKMMKEIAEVDLKVKSYNLSRYALLVGIISASGGITAMLYNIIKAQTTGSPPSPEAPLDIVKEVGKLVAQWMSESDENYWNDLAGYVENSSVSPKLTLGDQLLFMNYTMDLFPGEKFIWVSKQDAVDRVQLLVRAYRSHANQTSSMYRLVYTIKYQNQPLTRAVQAQLLRWALAAISTYTMKMESLLNPGEGEHGQEDHLSESDHDENKEQEHIEEIAKEAEKERESFVAQNHELVQNVNENINNIEVATFNSDGLTDARSELVRSDNSAIADPAKDSRLDRMEGILEKLMSKVEKEPKANKDKNTKSFLARFLGIALGAGALVAVIYEYTKRTSNNEPTDDIPISKETKDKLQQLVVKFKAEKDTTFWEDMAKYVESEKPTAADQALFCNYTIQLCPSAEPWLWDSALDKVKIVEILEDLYNKAVPQSTSVIYRNITLQTYNKQPLPRDVAADILRLTLAQIFLVPIDPK